MSKEDHLITSNRSHAYFKAGKLKEALEDAERTIALKPDWGKGYFRRGMALASLGNMEEALISYFQCLVLEESCSKALRTEIYKVQQFCKFYQTLFLYVLLAGTVQAGDGKQGIFSGKRR